MMMVFPVVCVVSVSVTTIYYRIQHSTAYHYLCIALFSQVLKNGLNVSTNKYINIYVCVCVDKYLVEETGSFIIRAELFTWLAVCLSVSKV